MNRPDAPSSAQPDTDTGAADIELGALPLVSTPAMDGTRPLLSQEVDETDLDEFFEVIRTRDNDAVDRFVAGLIRRGVTPESILTSLIPPTAREMGERWEGDNCDFGEVTLVLGRLQRLVRSTLRKIPASEGCLGPNHQHQILLTALPGQQHTLGLLITSHFFRLEGWGVEMGPPFLDGSTADRVAHMHFDVVAFSVATSSSLDDVAREIRQVRRKSRNRSVGILAGGERPLAGSESGRPGRCRCVGPGSQTRPGGGQGLYLDLELTQFWCFAIT